MPEPDKLQKLYNNMLKSERVTETELGDFESFKLDISDSAKAHKFYNRSIAEKTFNEKELGNWESFSGNLNEYFQAKPEQTEQPEDDWNSKIADIDKRISDTDKELHQSWSGLTKENASKQRPVIDEYQKSLDKLKKEKENLTSLHTLSDTDEGIKIFDDLKQLSGEDELRYFTSKKHQSETKKALMDKYSNQSERTIDMAMQMHESDNKRNLFYNKGLDYLNVDPSVISNDSKVEFEDFVGDDEKEAIRINKEIRDENKGEKNKSKITGLQNELKKLGRDTKGWMNLETGKRNVSKDKEQAKYDKSVNSLIDEYLKTTDEKLKDIVEKNYVIYKYLDNYSDLISNTYDYIATPTTTSHINQQFNKAAYDGSLKDEKETTQGELINAKAAYEASARAYYLNESPEETTHDFVDNLELAGKSFVQTLGGERIAHTIFGTDNVQRNLALSGILSEEGIQLTDEESEALETTNWEQFSQGIGATGGVVLQFMALNSLGQLAGVEKVLAGLEKGNRVMKAFAPVARLVYEDIKFQAIGAEPGAGAAFYGTSKILGKIKLPKSLTTDKFKNPITHLGKTLVRADISMTAASNLSHAATTIADGLINDKDWKYHLEQTFGKTRPENFDKLFTDLSINWAFGFSTFGHERMVEKQRTLKDMQLLEVILRKGILDPDGKTRKFDEEADYVKSIINKYESGELGYSKFKKDKDKLVKDSERIIIGTQWRTAKEATEAESQPKTQIQEPLSEEQQIKSESAEQIHNFVKNITHKDGRVIEVIDQQDNVFYVKDGEVTEEGDSWVTSKDKPLMVSDRDGNNVQMFDPKKIKTLNIETPEGLEDKMMFQTYGEVDAQREEEQEVSSLEEISQLQEEEAKPELPLDKDGNIDYDVLLNQPETFYDEFSKEFSEEEATEELDRIQKTIQSSIKTARKKSDKSTSVNERIAIKRQIKELETQDESIKETLASKASKKLKEALEGKPKEVSTPEEQTQLKIEMFQEMIDKTLQQEIKQSYEETINTLNTNPVAYWEEQANIFQKKGDKKNYENAIENVNYYQGEATEQPKADVLPEQVSKPEVSSVPELEKGETWINRDGDEFTVGDNLELEFNGEITDLGKLINVEENAGIFFANTDKGKSVNLNHIRKAKLPQQTDELTGEAEEEKVKLPDLSKDVKPTTIRQQIKTKEEEYLKAAWTQKMPDGTHVVRIKKNHTKEEADNIRKELLELHKKENKPTSTPEEIKTKEDIPLPPENKSDWSDWVLDYSDNIEEIYDAWNIAKENSPYSKLEDWQKRIADGEIATTKESFINANDENNIRGSLAIMFFKKDGTPLDVIAHDIFGWEGTRDEEAKIADFMLSLADDSYIKRKTSNTQRELAVKYKEVTGKPITQHQPKEIKVSKGEEVENILVSLVNNEGIDIKNLEQLQALKESHFKGFPFTEEQYKTLENNLKPKQDDKSRISKEPDTKATKDFDKQHKADTKKSRETPEQTETKEVKTKTEFAGEKVFPKVKKEKPTKSRFAGEALEKKPKTVSVHKQELDKFFKKHPNFKLISNDGVNAIIETAIGSKETFNGENVAKFDALIKEAKERINNLKKGDKVKFKDFSMSGDIKESEIIRINKNRKGGISSVATENRKLDVNEIIPIKSMTFVDIRHNGNHLKYFDSGDKYDLKNIQELLNEYNTIKKRNKPIDKVEKEQPKESELDKYKVGERVIDEEGNEKVIAEIDKDLNVIFSEENGNLEEIKLKHIPQLEKKVKAAKPKSLSDATTINELQELLAGGKVKKDKAYDERMEQLRSGDKGILFSISKDKSELTPDRDYLFNEGLTDPSKLKTKEDIADYNARVEIMDRLYKEGFLGEDFIGDLEEEWVLSQIGEKRHFEEIVEDKLDELPDKLFQEEKVLSKSIQDLIDKKVLKPSKIKENIEDYLESTDIPVNMSIEDLVIQSKGLTEDLNEAGYILSDGRLLDFSGKRIGSGGGDRVEDHRQLAIPYKEDIQSPSEVMNAFMRTTGAIRMDYNGGAIDIETEPTISQERLILKIIKKNPDTWNIDLQDGERKLSLQGGSIEMALNNIKRFYEDKTIGTGYNDIIRLSKQTFYSPTEAALKKIKQEKGIPEQFKAMLLKNGAKQVELDWMGWDTFVEGKKSITKQEIQDFINENEVELEEVVKKDVDDERYLSRADAEDMFDMGHEIYGIYSDNSESLIESKDDFDNFDKYALDEDFPINGATKFSDYQTPGGDNYKEFLLTLPTTKTLTYSTKKEGSQWIVIENETGRIVSPRPTTEDLANLYKDDFNSQKVVDKSKQFKSGHFDEPNIIVHTRTNERTEGKDRILNIDEIQSDWAGVLRKFGIEQKWNKDQLQVYSKEEASKEYGIKDNLWGISAKDENGNQVQVFQISKKQHPTQEDAINYIIENKPVSNENAAPDMPFKKNWHELGFKKMLRYAVENDFDKVTWVTGEQTADRYDLGKKVKNIEVTKGGERKSWNYRLLIDFKGEDGTKTEYLDTEKELEDTVGKDLATKIMADNLGAGQFKTYSGLDLKVGGEWAANLYDRTIPNFVKKYTKKWGGKVGTTEITTGKEIYSVWNKETGNSIGGGYTLEKAKQSVRENPDREYRKESGGTIKVHSLDITPAMRESVMQGQPMFNVKNPFHDGYKFAGERVENFSKDMITFDTQVRSAIEKLSKELKTPIAIVYEEKELPSNIRSAIKRQGAEGLTPGLFNPNNKKVYLILKNTIDVNNAVITALHEVVGHKGMRALLGDDFKPVMMDVFNSMSAEDIKELGSRYKTTDPLLIADEHFGQYAGHDKKPTYIKRAIAKIRELLRRLMKKLGFNIKYTDNDIYSLLARSREHLRKQKPKQAKDFEFAGDYVDNVKLSIAKEKEIKKDKPFKYPTIAELNAQQKKREDEANKSYDVIKEKINNIKEKYKTDKIIARENIKAVQLEIIKYAKRNIPFDIAGKRDIGKLLTMVKNTSNPDKLIDVFSKIDDISFGIKKKRNIAKIDILLKKTKAKKVNNKIQGKLSPDVQSTLDKIIEIRKIKGFDNLEESINKIDPENTEDIALFTLFSNLKDQSREHTDNSLRVLSEMINTGKVWYKEKVEARKAKLSEIRTKAINTTTGGKGYRSTREIRATEGKVVKDWFLKNWINHNQSFEWMLDIISKDKSEKTGQGWMQDYFGDIIQKATNDESRGTREQLELIDEKASDIFGSSKSGLAKIFRKNAKVEEKTDVTYKKDGERVEMPLSQNEAYKIWQDYQDKRYSSNFSRMGIDETTISQLEKFITPEIMEWAKWQLEEFYPKYYDGVNKKYKENYFVELSRSENYSPKTIEVTETADKDDGLLRQSKILSSVLNNSLKSTVQHSNEISIVDGDIILMRHIMGMEHFKAWVDGIRELRSIFGSRSMQHVLKTEHGNKVRQIINSQINDFARGKVDEALINTALDRVRGNFAAAELGLNYTLLPKQLVSVITYAMDIPTIDYFKGISEFAHKPAEIIKILSKSEWVINRYKKGWTQEVEAALKTVDHRLLAGTKSDLQKFKSVAMIATKLGDRFAIIGGWTVYSYYYKQQIKDNVSEPEARKFAMNKFERVASRSQQSPLLKDLSQAQKGSFFKLFTMFKTSQQQYFRYETAAWRNLRKGRGSKRHNLKILAITHLILPMAFQYLSSLLSGDDDDKTKKRLIRSAILGSYNGFLIVGDIIEFFVNKALGEWWGYTPTPVISSVTNLGVGIAQLAKQTQNIEGKKLWEGIKKLDKDLASNSLNDVELDKVLSGLDKMTHAFNQTITGLPWRPAKKLYRQAGDVLFPEQKGIKDAVEEAKSYMSKVSKEKDKVKKNALKLDSYYKSAKRIVLYNGTINDYKELLNDAEKREDKRNIKRYQASIATNEQKIIDEYKNIER